MEKLVGILGLAVFVGLAWVFSMNRRNFPVRTVVSGLGLQVLLGLFILRTSWGKWVFKGIESTFRGLLGFADEGMSMVFGPLANQELLTEKLGEGNAFIFLVTITGTIILVSALSSLLYHYGILQLIVRGVAFGMRKVMRTSGSESLAAAANIFMGQTEAPLVIKPYLQGMTRSESMNRMTFQLVGKTTHEAGVTFTVCECGGMMRPVK